MNYDVVCDCGQIIKSITFNRKNIKLKHIIMCEKCSKNHLIEIIQSKFNKYIKHSLINLIITKNNDKYKYSCIIKCHQCRRNLIELNTINDKKHILQDITCYGCDEYVTYEIFDNSLIVCGEISDLNRYETIEQVEIFQ